MVRKRLAAVGGLCVFLGGALACGVPASAQNEFDVPLEHFQKLDRLPVPHYVWGLSPTANLYTPEGQQYLRVFMEKNFHFGIGLSAKRREEQLAILCRLANETGSSIVPTLTMGGTDGAGRTARGAVNVLSRAIEQLHSFAELLDGRAPVEACLVNAIESWKVEFDEELPTDDLLRGMYQLIYRAIKDTFGEDCLVVWYHNSPHELMRPYGYRPLMPEDVAHDTVSFVARPQARNAELFNYHFREAARLTGDKPLTPWFGIGWTAAPPSTLWKIGRDLNHPYRQRIWRESGTGIPGHRAQAVIIWPHLGSDRSQDCWTHLRAYLAGASNVPLETFDGPRVSRP